MALLVELHHGEGLCDGRGDGRVVGREGGWKVTALIGPLDVDALWCEREGGAEDVGRLDGK